MPQQNSPDQLTPASEIEIAEMATLIRNAGVPSLDLTIRRVLMERDQLKAEILRLQGGWRAAERDASTQQREARRVAEVAEASEGVLILEVETLKAEIAALKQALLDRALTNADGKGSDELAAWQSTAESHAAIEQMGGPATDGYRIALQAVAAELNVGTDAGPIDEAWLRSIGFIQAPGPDWLWSGGKIHVAWNRRSNEWVIGGPGDDEEIAWEPAPTTRGQILRLLEALK